MTGSSMYSMAKVGIGAASDVYGAWQTGEQYEAQMDAYEQDSFASIDRNKASYQIREQAKDQANLGGIMMSEAYLYTGKKKLNSIVGQINDINDQSLLKESIAYEQSLAVDEAVGNMMSRNAIDAMKAEARLRAGAAGSGTSGGTTQAATYEARSVQMFDNAVVIGRASAEKLNIQRRLSMDRVSDKNKKAYIASEMSQVMGASGAGAAWQKGYNMAYEAIPKSIKEGYISYDKVVREDTSTWLDSVFNITDVITDYDLDTALAGIFIDDKGSVRDADALYDKMFPTENVLAAQKKA